MNEDQYIWWRGDNNELRSVGYPIKNIFKAAGLPALHTTQHPLLGSQRGGALAIPAGLVHGLMEEQDDVDPTSVSDMGVDESSGLYNKLLELAAIGGTRVKEKKSKKSRKRLRAVGKKKHKTRKRKSSNK